MNEDELKQKKSLVFERIRCSNTKPKVNLGMTLIKLVHFNPKDFTPTKSNQELRKSEEIKLVILKPRKLSRMK